MARFSNLLDTVRVATPCESSWDQMAGDQRVRHCDQCDLNVYNLSGMSRKAAEAMLNNTEGRVCVRFYRRLDGTIITADCPVGIRALRRKIARVAAAGMAAVLSFLAGIGLYSRYQPTGQIDRIESGRRYFVRQALQPKSIDQNTSSGVAVMGQARVVRDFDRRVDSLNDR